MSKAPPAFQFYPADFVMGTAEMSATEVGCYMLLLCHQWATGSIPDEKGSLSSGLTRICRGENPSHLVMSKFVSDGKGRLFNERLEFERDKQAKYREAQALNGKKGGRPKAKLTQPLTQPLSQPLTDGFALALNRLNPDESSSSSDFSLKTAGAPASTPAVCVLPSASLIPDTEIRILKTDPVLFQPEGRALKPAGARNGAKAFQKPTVDQVSEYCHERMNLVDPQTFVDFYEAKGWRIGKDPMKDWHAAVRTWEKRATSDAISQADPRGNMALANNYMERHGLAANG